MVFFARFSRPSRRLCEVSLNRPVPSAFGARFPMSTNSAKVCSSSQPHRCFGFGKRAAVVNVDFQKAYTSGEFQTSYETDPAQVDYVNQLSALARAQGLPVVWTRVAYAADASDAGVWGTRTDTPDSLQNIKVGSRRAEFDDRLDLDGATDTVYLKKMPSAFH